MDPKSKIQFLSSLKIQQMSKVLAAKTQVVSFPPCKITAPLDQHSLGYPKPFGWHQGLSVKPRRL